MQLVERALELDLGDVARTRQIDTRQSPMMRAAGPADMMTTRSDSAIASSRS